eukprot:CAMPEP_0196810350 /NCGR_PEP_ID=MMETSP1362-20130617/10161_1 /TAXON_ID=163516 /ORGANISM="Leptocylindrus danicus, Strain CCMP1856" /LENGTH=349 /DNA_ID=CAMNT_0042185293 /DNA_START=136 /DNA_END=1185 /DNA_ORIENTATION=-
MSTVKARTGLDDIGKDGAFKRKESVWRDIISEDESCSKFQPESGRYHLVVAMACPWAHRALIVRALKGLEDAISVSIAHPIWRKTKPDNVEDEHCGWVFGDPNGEPFPNTKGLGGPFPPAYPGNEPDPIKNSFAVRDLYEFAQDTNGKYTVPILWDKKLNTIVNNESSEIIRMLSSKFNEFAKNPDLDIYPETMRKSIDSVNEWIYSTINNGVYKCGFAKSQEAYTEAITNLTESFDRVESILGKQRFIAGDTFTEADIRLFVTLLRFDEVYVVYFKTNTRSVLTSPNILNYCREIYQMDGVAGTVDMEQIKTHYFASHPYMNMYSIIPQGRDFVGLLSEQHNRGELFP